MVFVAHLKNKMRFTSRNFKFKIPLNCTDGTTLPQYGIYKKQKTGTNAAAFTPNFTFTHPFCLTIRKDGTDIYFVIILSIFDLNK